MSSLALEIRGLEKSFRRFKLGPVDVTVPRGAIYGFIGPNGAGKTTTIDLIFGMGAKDAGKITVLGLDHRRHELQVKQQVGYVSPDLDFQPWTRVGRAIQFVRGFYPSWDEAYCDQLMRAFQLTREDRITTLSFGGRIKLAVLLALAWRPALLILDEPTVGLDAISKRQMFGELLAAVRDESRTVFISSHAITDLERFADHVGMIKQGRMVFEGAVADVLERYRLVDIVLDPPAEFTGQPGLVVQKRDANRWQMLLDRRLARPDALTAAGARVLGDTSVSLEDLFIALGRD